MTPYKTCKNNTLATKPPPDLPDDLVRYIMEIAIETGLSTAASFMPICKTVQDWMIPIIYEGVRVHDEDQIMLLARTMRAYRQHNLGKNIRRLFIKSSGGAFYTAAADIVHTCINLECLVTNDTLDCWTTLDDLNSSWPSPWHVMLLHDESEYWGPRTHFLLRNVTHLYLDYVDSSVLREVRSLTQLTHLGLACWGDKDFISYPHDIKITLNAIPSLNILLLFAYLQRTPSIKFVGYNWVKLAEIEDTRLFARPGLSDRDYTAIINSGATVWDHAETKYKDWRDICVDSDF